MQGSRVRIPRGPATVMRAFRALSRVAASVRHESTIDGGVRTSAAARSLPPRLFVLQKHPFETERVFYFADGPGGALRLFHNFCRNRRKSQNET